jgi:MFS family permease
MLAGAALLAATLALLAAAVLAVELSWPLLLAAWLVAGLGYSTVLTPAGRLLRRSAHAEDRPAIFAAQFALSHACWLVTYPLAGVLMTRAGAPATLLVLCLVCGLGILAARRLWPASDPEVVEHRHDDLPLDHPHLAGRRTHSHTYIIDDHHRHWGQG